MRRSLRRLGQSWPFTPALLVSAAIILVITAVGADLTARPHQPAPAPAGCGALITCPAGVHPDT